MDSSSQRTRTIRMYVLAGALIGLALTLLLAFAWDDGTLVSGVGFVLLFGSPFLLALLSLALPRIEQQRWVWLACSLLTVAAGVPLIFNGVGIFFLAIAVDFAWAFAAAGARRSPGPQGP